MQNVVVCVGLSIQQVCATVVRHYRAWTDKEIQTLQSGLQAEVRTNENYPRYIVLGGHHDLDTIHTTLGGEPQVLIVTYPESDDDLPFDIPH